MKSEGRRTNDIRSVLRLRTYVVAMVIIALDTAYIATRRCASTKRTPPHQVQVVLFLCQMSIITNKKVTGRQNKRVNQVMMMSGLMPMPLWVDGG
jgi:hypothetical protein